ncbi:MAG: M48 family metalloprotease [Desulfobacter sp.]
MNGKHRKINIVMKIPLFIFIILFGLTGCAYNQATGKCDFVLITEREEIEAREFYEKKIKEERELYIASNKLNTYLGEVLDKVSINAHRKTIKYRVLIIDEPEIYAFSVPGGTICISRGLLCFLKSEAELAAIIAHEIAHIDARHTIKEFSYAVLGDIIFMGTESAYNLLPASLLTSKISESFINQYRYNSEVEADKLAYDYLRKSGYPSDALLSVLIDTYNYFNLYYPKEKIPNSYKRRIDSLKSLRADDSVYNKVEETKLLRQRYYRNIEGITFGASDRYAVIKKNQYLDMINGIKISYPNNWTITYSHSYDSRQTIDVLSPDRSIGIRTVFSEYQENSTSDGILEAVKYSSHARVTQLREEKPECYEMLYPGNTLCQYVCLDKNQYILSESIKGGCDASIKKLIRRTTLGISKMDNTEIDSIKTPKISILKIKKDTTFLDLAKNSKLNGEPEKILRHLNGFPDDEEPNVGDMIKIVN